MSGEQHANLDIALRIGVYYKKNHLRVDQMFAYIMQDTKSYLVEYVNLYQNDGTRVQGDWNRSLNDRFITTMQRVAPLKSYFNGLNSMSENNITMLEGYELASLFVGLPPRVDIADSNNNSYFYEIWASYGVWFNYLLMEKLQKDIPESGNQMHGKAGFESCKVKPVVKESSHAIFRFFDTDKSTVCPKGQELKFIDMFVE